MYHIFYVLQKNKKAQIPKIGTELTVVPPLLIYLIYKNIFTHYFNGEVPLQPTIIFGAELRGWFDINLLEVFHQ